LLFVVVVVGNSSKYRKDSNVGVSHTYIKLSPEIYFAGLKMKFVFVFISMYLKIPVSPLTSLSTAEYSVYICILHSLHPTMDYFVGFVSVSLLYKCQKYTHTFFFFGFI